MNKIICFVLILNSICFTSCSQPIDKQKLDSFFKELSDQDMALGSIAISKNGIVEYQKTIGYAQINKNKKTSATIDTKYRIGSVSKMFTTVLIFQLIEEGQLELDHYLSKYFPHIPNANSITIKNLLNHSSGLSNYADEQGFQVSKYEAISKDVLHEIIKKSSSNFNPGKKHEYSNTNFLLLSFLIEKLSGKSYEKVLTDRIISNLGLKNTYYETAPDTIRKGSKSYKYFDGKWVQQREVVAENHIGAGAIVSTPSDLVKFIDALFSFKLISKQNVNKMTDLNDEYGLGIFSFQFKSNTAYGHEGRINEYYTSLLHFSDDNLSIAYCTNGILYPRDDIINAVSQICSGEEYSIPHFNGKKINSEVLKVLIGKYASDNIPIKVECKLVDGKLTVETQGKIFETKNISENYFANYQYGYFFEFIPEKEELFIKETDNVYYLKKK